MDYFKVIKSYLEENNCTKALANLHLDADTILKAGLDSNLCCSNSSFLFVYLEQAASFLSLSLNRLCKSPNQSIDGSIQVIQPLKFCVHLIADFNCLNS